MEVTDSEGEKKGMIIGNVRMKIIINTINLLHGGSFYRVDCFPNCELLHRDSPVELLGFLNCQFAKAVTLFSTSIHSIPADETVFLGLDYDMKVKQSWMKYMGVSQVNS